jgi:hypothetical protein
MKYILLYAALLINSSNLIFGADSQKAITIRKPIPSFIKKQPLILPDEPDIVPYAITQSHAKIAKAVTTIILANEIPETVTVYATNEAGDDSFLLGKCKPGDLKKWRFLARFTHLAVGVPSQPNLSGPLEIRCNAYLLTRDGDDYLEDYPLSPEEFNKITKNKSRPSHAPAFPSDENSE